MMNYYIGDYFCTPTALFTVIGINKEKQTLRLQDESKPDRVVTVGRAVLNACSQDQHNIVFFEQDFNLDIKDGE